MWVKEVRFRESLLTLNIQCIQKEPRCTETYGTTLGTKMYVDLQYYFWSNKMKRDITKYVNYYLIQESIDWDL